MTDLDKPLGRDRPRRRSDGAGKARPRNAGIRLGAAIALLVAVGAINLGVLVADDAPPRTALAMLPETPPGPDAATTTGAVKPAEATPEATPAAPAAEVERADLPLPTFDDGGDRVSPGGPKIISVRDPAAASVGQPLQLAHLPEDDALEDSAFGPLPVRTANGRRPMEIYARPWSGSRGKRIAIVIGGLGLSQTGTHRAIETLPPEITLAFAPTGNSLQRWMREARRKGHELLVQVPMEPHGYPDIDPGPRTLRLASSAETNLENLHWALGRLTNYTGVMNYMGARFAAAPAAMAPVLDDLSERGLLFFNDGAAGDALAGTAADRAVPYLEGDIVIDASRNRADIEARLKALEELAAARGYAVGSGSALDLTVSTVADWADGARKRGFELVGVASLAAADSEADALQAGPVPADTLPYRPCAGMMVLNREGLVWIGGRMKEGNTEYSGDPLLWQMPQGGIDPGEEPLPAAMRELYEETGIRSVELIETAPRPIRYDLPAHMIGIGLKGRYRGQEQHWFAFRFVGEEDEIRIDPPPDGHKPEFDAWQWAEMATLPDRIVGFKRDAYRQVVDMFAHLAGTRA